MGTDAMSAWPVAATSRVPNCGCLSNATCASWQWAIGSTAALLKPSGCQAASELEHGAGAPYAFSGWDCGRQTGQYKLPGRLRPRPKDERKGDEQLSVSCLILVKAHQHTECRCPIYHLARHLGGARGPAGLASGQVLPVKPLADVAVSC